MLRESNSIIIIDDDERELHELSKIFHDRGIGCKAIQYTGEPGPSLTGVRILFLDINLNSATSDSQRNNTLKDTVETYIDENNGPFILVFWTSNIAWASQFCTFINERISRNINEPIAKRNPFFISVIDKNEFRDNRIQLEEKVEMIFNTPTVKTLLDFESLMSDSVWSVISEIINIIPRSNEWGDTEVFDNNVKDVFARIAISTLGFSNAKRKPDLAIKEAIIPLYLHKISRNETNNVWESYLDNLSVASSINEIRFPSDFNESVINSSFHVDMNVSTVDQRGAVSKFETSNPKIFEDIFGIEIQAWFKALIKDAPGVEYADSDIIAIEISAACDYSQQKNRVRKFILGVAIPGEKMVIQTGKKKGKLVELQGYNAYLIPHKFSIDDNIVMICFDLNYTFTLQMSMHSILAPWFCFKKEIVDMIGNKYANHISRIGITAF